MKPRHVFRKQNGSIFFKFFSVLFSFGLVQMSIPVKNFISSVAFFSRLHIMGYWLLIVPNFPSLRETVGEGKNLYEEQSHVGLH